MSRVYQDNSQTDTERSDAVVPVRYSGSSDGLTAIRVDS